MYDNLLDEDPDIQERIARGKLHGAQGMVVTIIEARFPTCAQLAQEQVPQIKNFEDLRMVVKLIAIISNENLVVWILNKLTA